MVHVATILLGATFVGLSLVSSVPPFIGMIIYTITTGRHPRVGVSSQRKSLLLIPAVTIALSVNVVLGILVLLNNVMNHWFIIFMTLIALAMNGLALLTIQSHCFIRQTLKVCAAASIILCVIVIIVFR